MNKLIAILVFVFTLTPSALLAEVEPSEVTFKAEVIEILKEESPEGTGMVLQDLLLRVSDDPWKGRIIQINGTSKTETQSDRRYFVGDKVEVSQIITPEGTNEFVIVGIVRTGYLFLLALIFGVIIVGIGKMKGIKALIGLAASFFIILKFIIPKIVAGSNPILIGVLGSLLILTAIIYFTEGWNPKSHIAVISVFFSLCIISILTLIFTKLTRLTGLAAEEALFLIGPNGSSIDFKGLLLTGILIGSIGVMDDVIIGQVESVQQIRLANPGLSRKQLFTSAYEVGKSHLSAIINTLFLTYVGASLPLLLLFQSNPAGQASFLQVLNDESIATEIVRTLVGSIGIALSVPISTLCAVVWFKNKTNTDSKNLKSQSS